ncbi:hypothetical protein BdWA1_002235 [Babesia duncani]|uniref:Uncharacterized protein n=1 Tax=Babesia duncani TaxID=323732 RepID=A0AAD9PLD9_9APIC|nr:hypothetical protein BdWA1_002235 [Babesia duncani]
MATQTERMRLLEQHAQLSREIAGIKADIERLVRNNEMLRNQNSNMQKILQGSNNTRIQKSAAKSNMHLMHAPHKVKCQNPCVAKVQEFPADYVLDAITQVGDAAKTEILKHAKTVLDDVAKRFSSDVIMNPFNQYQSQSDYQRYNSTLSSDESNDNDAIPYLTDEESTPIPRKEIKNIEYKNISVNSAR